VTPEPAAVETLARLRRRLLEARTSEGHWVGELSSSALATATAVGALALAHRSGLAVSAALISGGRRWLADHRNADGGWGDTVLSSSNVSTTALVWGAFALAAPLEDGERPAEALAETWLRRAAGALDAPRLAQVLADRYGKDRTFSAPILTFLAVSGRLGLDPWRHVAQLPFELAAIPPRRLGAVGLPVVSYALPALIAIGQVRHRHRPTRNPITRLARLVATTPTLRTLEALQPPSGGYLEAIPLTSFVVLSLLAAGRPEHPVVSRGLAFLADAVRPDGSWPIDTDLACWVTTLATLALDDALPADERRRLLPWILACQQRSPHPYTGAAAGGWAWTNRSGGVPDADDTAGALLALAAPGNDDPATLAAASAGVEWLLGLQNRDGGIPTFCRGWGTLPFDRSSPDLTAHSLRAFVSWRSRVTPRLRAAIDRAIQRALRYLAREQRADGSWVPLWFGNEATAAEENPTYGTAQVVRALAIVTSQYAPAEVLLDRGQRWLLAAQNPDGGWGGGPGAPATIEETSLAVMALASGPAMSNAPATPALHRGVARLILRTDRGRVTPPAPIGLYFARLWYFESLYPLIFATAALQMASKTLDWYRGALRHRR
jgi:squalene-hopene/tetraprenyl-beta-curcumene cyclase